MKRRTFLAAALTAPLTAHAIEWFNIPERPKAAAAVEPHMVILIDASGSSPVFDAGFRRGVLQAIAPQILALPVGAILHVLTVGDPKQIGGQWTRRIQKRADAQGITREMAPQAVGGLLEQAQRLDQNESALADGVRQAAALLNPRAGQAQSVLYITDGVERAVAHGTRERIQRGRVENGALVADPNGPTVIRAYASYALDCLAERCVLPSPTYKAPPLATMRMYGVGIGVEANKGQELARAWRKHLTQAGFTDIEIYRTY